MGGRVSENTLKNMEEITMPSTTFNFQPDINEYEIHLESENKHPDTVKKYVHDITELYTYLSGQGLELDQTGVDCFLKDLSRRGYSIRSVNAAVASIKSFCRFAGRTDISCKNLRVRKRDNKDRRMLLTPEEYFALIQMALMQRNFRMAQLIQVLSGTGIKLNELKYLTVEAVEEGVVMVQRAGEEYEIYLPMTLMEGLKKFLEHEKISTGPVFVTSRGNPVDRSYVWRELKTLAVKAGVNPDKVYPQNLKRQLATNYVTIPYPK